MKTYNSPEKMLKSVILKDLIGQEIKLDCVRCYIDNDGMWLYPDCEYTEHIANQYINSLWGKILDMKIDDKPMWQRKQEPDGIDYEMPIDPFMD